ncbi:MULTISPECIES: ABC transporter substrate-binding protein [Enterococcus]|uniref:ABC transporter substrate-binding protein n=1 Tax=Enterococcus TaxID=1350 RepID=UPI000330E10F|nr:sugar ABC transporter substrate-binding protein [Enterococcus mundtii]EOH61443.1 sugar ABC transporter sugar-binding protein [Enterococcus mundtii ATCC 882]EOU12283.1 sugar ABC transporter sugar-binding protein [Enterococcus mundtii ATCC 882]MBE9910628.1 sugar ABC transporter substrate-binding protein [Enterococcus mundtii]MCA6773875.1 sugar ABC transporter substrate-binding protein [Enterococcus mundtii]QCJ55989.1 sugar ABC transporter substrate-binding protein [Enterococcus mundtii]
MKFWKKSLVTGLLVSGGLWLGACGNENQAQDQTDGTVLTVSTWNYDTTPEFDKLFRAFEKENPGVTVKPVDIASDDYDTKLTTMLASGDSTDVLTMKNLLSYSNYALRDQLVDLSSHIKDLDTDPAMESYEMYDIDGKTYAQPYRTDFWVLYYNKNLFDEAGLPYPDNLTWEEYEELAKELSKPEEQVYGAYQHTWRSTVQAIAAAQNNKNLVEPDYGFLGEYYDRVLRMQEDQAQMDFGTAKSTNVTYQSQFENSKAGMMYMGSWYMGALLTNIDAGTTDVEWGISQMPQNEKGKEIQTFGSPTAFAINKNSKEQELAQKFLDFCSGEAGAKVLAEVGVVPSYRTDAINELYFSHNGMPNDEVSQTAFKPEKIAIEFPVDENGPAIDKILQEEHELILVGDETPKEAIGNMEKRVKQESE